MKYSWLFIVLLVSCQGGEKDAGESVDQAEVFVAPDQPDHSFYVDEDIAPSVNLEFGEADSAEMARPVIAIIDNDRYTVVKYEGTLMNASPSNDGYFLRFEPFHEYDDDLEQEIKSEYDFYLDVFVNKDQNKTLGYVEQSESTNNLKWDYFENLFKVFYYEKEGVFYPLKMENLGKTEWDG
jgi:hypothetical protein